MVGEKRDQAALDGIYISVFFSRKAFVGLNISRPFVEARVGVSRFGSEPG